MGFPVYYCETDFPGRIPELLKDFGVRIKLMPTKTTASCAFAYDVTRGLAAIRIARFKEDDGQFVFSLIFGRNFNPFTWRSSHRLSSEIHAVLTNAGAKPAWVVEPIK